MYPQHMNSGSWFTAVQNWQYPNATLATDYQKMQYTFRNTSRRQKKKKKRPAQLQQFLALLNILLHDFHRNLWMHKHNEHMCRRSTWIYCVFRVFLIIFKVSYISLRPRKKPFLGTLSQEHLVNKDSESRNVTETSTNRGILSKKQIWLKD